MEMASGKDLEERNKAVARILLKESKQAFIKDTQNNIYFCDILSVEDVSLVIRCFGPSQRRGREFTLYFPLVLTILPYEDNKGGANR